MLIGLTGSAGAGKDTVHETLVELYGADQVARRSFTDPMYESAARALGVTADDLRRWKRNPQIRICVGPRCGDVVHPGVEITARQFLQRYGTEAHRDVFGEDFWVKAVDLSHRGLIVAVTDVRFENEALAVHSAGGVTVRVLGPQDDGAEGHASEVPLHRRFVDYTIDNAVRDDGRRYLRDQVRHLVTTLRRARGEMP